MAAITGTGHIVYIGLEAKEVQGATNLDTSTGAHRYWRLYLDDNFGGATTYALNSWRMYDINRLEYPATDEWDFELGQDGNSTDTYSTNSLATDVYNLFENFTGSSVPDWNSNSGEGGTEIWIQVEFVEAKDIRKYELINSGKETSNTFDGAPSAFRLAYSDDGISWFIRHTGTAEWPENGVQSSTGSAWTASYPDERFVKIQWTGTDAIIYGSATLEEPTATGVSTVQSAPPAANDGTGELTLNRFWTVTGELYNDLGTAYDLEELTITGTVLPGQVGTAEAELPGLTGSGSLVTDVYLTSTSTLGYLSATGSTFDEADALQLPLLTSTGTALGGQVLSGEVELLALTANASTDTALLPKLTATGTGTTGQALTSGTMAIPRLTAQGSTDAALLEPLTATGTMIGGRSLAGSMTLQRMTGAGAINAETSLPALTATGQIESGKVLTGDITLQRLTATGSINALITLPTLSATGVLNTGNAISGDIDLQRMTATGSTDILGALPKLTVTGTIDSGRVLSGSIALRPLTATGAINTLATLPALTVTGTIESGAVIAGANNLSALTAAGALNETASLAPLTATGTVDAVLTASATTERLTATGIVNTAASLQPLTATGALATPLTGTVTLERLTGSGAINTVARLEPLTATGTLIPGTAIAGAVTLEPLTIAGEVNAVVNLPVLSLTGTIEPGVAIAGAMSTERPSAIGSINQLATLPKLTATGTGVTGNALNGAVALQRLTATGSANDTAALEPLTLSATGLSGVSGIGIAVLNKLEVAGIIDNATATAITGSMQALPLISSGTVINGNIYNGSVALQKLTLAATGTSGQLITGSVILPLLGGTGELSGDLTGSISVDLPGIFITGSINRELGTPAGNALTMNLKNKALTTFTGYGYNSFAEFNGVTLAASSSGVFALSGETDNGALIDASVRLGKLDFDIQQLKTVDYAYAGYSSDGNLNLTIKADDGTEYCYSLEPRESGRHSSRVKLGKGISGRYLQFGFDNVQGADFTLDTLEMVERVLKRRVS